MRRNITINRGSFNEQLSIPSGYNLNDPGTRTLLPIPFGMLAYEPNQDLVYYSSENSWKVLGFNPSGPTGMIGPLVVIDPDVFVNQTLFVDLIHTTGSGEKDDMTKPYPSIENAIANADSGDTIVVRPGSYTVSNSLLPSNKSLNFYFEPGSIVTSNETIFHANLPLETSHKYNILGYGEFYSNEGVILVEGEGSTELKMEANIISYSDVGNNSIITSSSANSVLYITSNQIRQNASDHNCILVLNGIIYVNSNSIIQDGFGFVFSQNTFGISYINFETMVSKARSLSILNGGISYINGKSITLFTEEDSGGRFFQSNGTTIVYLNVDTISVYTQNTLVQTTTILILEQAEFHINCRYFKTNFDRCMVISTASNPEDFGKIFVNVDTFEMGPPFSNNTTSLLLTQGRMNLSCNIGRIINSTQIFQRTIIIGAFTNDSIIDIKVKSSSSGSQQLEIFENPGSLPNTINIQMLDIDRMFIFSSNEETSLDISFSNTFSFNLGTVTTPLSANLKIKCLNIKQNLFINHDEGNITIDAVNLGTPTTPIILEIVETNNLLIKSLNLISNNKLTLVDNKPGKITRFDVNNISLRDLEITNSSSNSDNPWRFALKTEYLNLGLEGTPEAGNLEILSDNFAIYDFYCDIFKGNLISTPSNFRGKFRFISRSSIFLEPETVNPLGIRIGNTILVSDFIPDVDIRIENCKGTNLIIETQEGVCRLDFGEISLSQILNIQGCESSNSELEPSILFKSKVLNHMSEEELSSENLFSIGTDLSMRIRDTGSSLLRDPAVIGNDGGVPGDTFPLGTHTRGTLIFDVETLRTTQNVQICGSSHEADLDNIDKASEMIRVEILGKSWNIENGRITTGAYQKAQVVYDVGVINWHQLSNASDESFIYDTDPESHSPVIEMLFGNSDENSEKGGSVVFKDTTVVNLNGSDGLENVKNSSSTDCMILWMSPRILTIQRNSSWIIKGEDGVTDAGAPGNRHIAMFVFNNKGFNVMPVGFEHTFATFSQAFWT